MAKSQGLAKRSFARTLACCRRSPSRTHQRLRLPLRDRHRVSDKGFERMGPRNASPSTGLPDAPGLTSIHSVTRP